MSDRILGGIGLLLAALYIWQAQLIQLSFISDPIGPRTFPAIIGGLMALASLAILLRPDTEPHWPGFGRLAEIAATVAVLTAYAVFLPDLGFLIATTLAAAYLGWRLGTAPLWAVVTGLGTAVGIYIVFKLILGLSLAEGPLGF